MRKLLLLSLLAGLHAPEAVACSCGEVQPSVSLDVQGASAGTIDTESAVLLYSHYGPDSPAPRQVRAWDATAGQEIAISLIRELDPDEALVQLWSPAEPWPAGHEIELSTWYEFEGEVHTSRPAEYLTEVQEESVDTPSLSPVVSHVYSEGLGCGDSQVIRIDLAGSADEEVDYEIEIDEDDGEPFSAIYTWYALDPGLISLGYWECWGGNWWGIDRSTDYRLRARAVNLSGDASPWTDILSTAKHQEPDPPFFGCSHAGRAGSPTLPLAAPLALLAARRIRRRGRG